MKLNSELGLKRFKVVLVGTKIPENIGASARLLENFQVGDATLVEPKCDWKTGVAQWMATGKSLARLNALPVTHSLAEAVQDCHFVVGFTARSGKSRKTSIQLESLAKKLSGKVALVFGREDFCLLKDEIEICTHLCALDTHPSFPALNLSHSVAVVLSQLFLSENNSRKGHRVLSTASEQEPMFLHLREMMMVAGMTKDGNPDRMLTRLRKVLQRAELSKQDLNLWRGLFSAVISALKKHSD